MKLLFVLNGMESASSAIETTTRIIAPLLHIRLFGTSLLKEIRLELYSVAVLRIKEVER